MLQYIDVFYDCIDTFFCIFNYIQKLFFRWKVFLKQDSECRGTLWSMPAQILVVANLQSSIK